MSKPPLTIGCQTVCSSAFSARAARALVESYRKCTRYNPEHLKCLETWAKNGGGHLPIMWGSGWACDVPLYIAWLERKGVEALGPVFDRLNADENSVAWQLCLRVAEAVRAGGNPHSVAQITEMVGRRGCVCVGSEEDRRAVYCIWLDHLNNGAEQWCGEQRLWMDEHSAIKVNGKGFPVRIVSGNAKTHL